MNLNVKPIFFANPQEFRNWLLQHHEKATELFVGFYKVNSGKESMTWSESVDQAICFGWIDGVRKSIDKESYLIRFTPRRPTSIWSAVNIKKVAELTAKGLMMPKGIESFNMRTELKSKIYSYEKEDIKLSDEFENKFITNKKAWEFFKSLPKSYQKAAIDWVITGKEEVTRIKRLDELIRDSEAGRKIKRLNY